MLPHNVTYSATGGYFDMSTKRTERTTHAHEGRTSVRWIGQLIVVGHGLCDTIRACCRAFSSELLRRARSRDLLRVTVVNHRGIR
jgi:hypothetical protein